MATYYAYSHGGLPHKTFSLTLAKRWAKQEAHRTGRLVMIHTPDGRGGPWYVKPPKPSKKGENPAASLPRNKWINAKVKITKSGNIVAQIGSPLLKSNRLRKSRNRKRR